MTINLDLKAFEYINPASIDEAVAVLGKDKAKVMAGGTDLLGGMKDGLQDHHFEVLVNIKSIPNMAYIKENGNTIAIGAATRVQDVADDPVVKEKLPVLAQAAGIVASPQIRNLGTLGGNLAQRPRCWYYRHELFHCYKKGGDFCFAVTGSNKYHAILGGELCYIVHPSDTAPALMALNATAKIVGPNGEKMVPFDDFFIGPRVDVLRENVMGPQDILVEVQVPVLKPNTKSIYLKYKERGVWDFALTSVAAVATINSGTWEDGRIVLGGVAPVPWPAREADNFLAGKTLDESTAREAADRALFGARPMTDNSFKIDLAKGLIERALLSLL
ncbi:MAG: xanthine dehydrogenase family protein subunit M [Ardenticatenaceae bacterium]|nr:xanthine dehydrogenase family protein subunit M [Ardenticatenaceae bacterium]